MQQWEPGSQRAQAALVRRQIWRGVLLLGWHGSELAGGVVLCADGDPVWNGVSGPASYLHKLAVERAFAG